MVHLIFVCKYRKRLLDRLGVDVKSIIHTIAEENKYLTSNVSNDLSAIKINPRACYGLQQVYMIGWCM